jgi:hypothetical protein
METAKDISDNLMHRIKHLQEFVVKYNIQHTVGHPARIFVHAMTQEEAERQVDDWFGEAIE